MAKFMGSKQMYKDSPKLSRGEDGKMSVHKKEQSEANTEDASAGHEGEPVHVKKEEHEHIHAKHNLERHLMHARHEHEHHTHEGKDIPKHELHEKHAKEHGDMLRAHTQELAGAMEASEGKGE